MKSNSSNDHTGSVELGNCEQENGAREDYFAQSSGVGDQNAIEQTDHNIWRDDRRLKKGNKPSNIAPYQSDFS